MWDRWRWKADVEVMKGRQPCHLLKELLIRLEVDVSRGLINRDKLMRCLKIDGVTLECQKSGNDGTKVKLLLARGARVCEVWSGKSHLKTPPDVERLAALALRKSGKWPYVQAAVVGGRGGFPVGVLWPRYSRTIINVRSVWRSGVCMGCVTISRPPRPYYTEASHYSSRSVRHMGSGDPCEIA